MLSPDKARTKTPDVTESVGRFCQTFHRHSPRKPVITPFRPFFALGTVFEVIEINEAPSFGGKDFVYGIIRHKTHRPDLR